MKIECTLDKISNPTQIVSRTTSKNNSIPSLQGILLTAKNNTLILTATNIDIGVEYKIPVKVEKEGAVLVDGDIFSKTIQAIDTKEKNITIELNENILSIKTKNNTIQINTLQKDDFPTLPIVEGTTTQIQKSVFENGIKSVMFSCANTDIKPEIAAVHIYTEPGQMVFVATDSFRLAEKKIKIKTNTEINILIPNNT